MGCFGWSETLKLFMGYWVAVIGGVAAGLALVSLGLFHEIRWQRRLARWARTHGTVVGSVVDQSDYPESYFPEIEYEVEDETRRFVSKYGSKRSPMIGSQVSILFDPAGTGAEQLESSNRWIWTIVPVLFGVFFIVVGVSSKPIRAEEPPRREDHTSQPEARPIP